MKKNSIKLRISNESDGEQIFKTIIAHSMETGYRRDKETGENIPANYIDKFQISVDGELYVEMVLSEFVSKNPYFSFTFTKPVFDNQVMQVSWFDNYLYETIYDLVVKFNTDGRFYYTGEKEGSELIQLLPQAGPICESKSPKQ